MKGKLLAKKVWICKLGDTAKPPSFCRKYQLPCHLQYLGMTGVYVTKMTLY